MSGAKCDYGCGQEAKYKFRNGMICCSEYVQQCPIKRKERSDKFTGKDNPLYGRKQLGKTKKLISESKLGKPRDELTKKKLRDFRKGKNLEEIVGEVKAEKIKGRLREFMHNRPDLKYQTKGKTYEEIMGEDRAKIRLNKLKKQIGKDNPFFGKNHSDESKQMMKESWTEERRNEATNQMKNGKAFYIYSFVDREKHSKKMREMCNNGHAAYMNKFIKNPSKPQVELYRMVLEVCPCAILNHPCLNYSIDITIPFLNIAIEYDEPYWHQDKDYDKKRQSELEDEGWIFLRYSSLPEKKEIREAINSFIKLRNI